MATRVLLLMCWLAWAPTAPVAGGDMTWADALTVRKAPVVVPPKPIETDDPGGGGGFRLEVGRLADVPDELRPGGGAGVGAVAGDRGAGGGAAVAVRRPVVAVWSWRTAPDNPAVDLYTDGRTWTAWRWKPGMAPAPVMMTAPAVAPSYGVYCPPGGT